jgi:hypothetical protein
MKITIKIFLAFTVVVIICSFLKLFDLSVSYTYEVSQPIAMSMSDKNVIERGHELNQFIFWIGVVIFYCIFNAILLIYLLLQMKYSKINSN